MILVQHSGHKSNSLVFFRAYHHYHHALQQRITHLLKFIKQRDVNHLLPTLNLAIAQLESLTGASVEAEDYTLAPSPISAVLHPPPPWLLVRLCSKTSLLVVTNLPYIPPELLHILSAYRVLPTLERVIKLFIGLPIFHEYWHFNRLLLALSLYADSPTDGRHMARLAILLLKTMTERELTLTKKTYRFLLQNQELHHAHLESFLRIFAHNKGSVHDAAAYAHAIHSVDRHPSKPPALSEANQTEPSISRNATVEYLTHLVHENSQRVQFNADAEWLRFVNTGLSHRFLNKRDTSSAAWAARLLSLSRTRSFSPQSLVAFFEWSHAQRFPFRTHTTLSYTVVLRGLLRKGAYTLALKVWESFRSHGTRKLRLDSVALGVGVEVLTRAGHPDRALALIDIPVERSRVGRKSGSLSQVVTRPHVPASVVTRFMRVLGATNPSATMRLWEHMGTLYGTTPDAHAFTIMLDAARHALFMGKASPARCKSSGSSGFVSAPRSSNGRSWIRMRIIQVSDERRLRKAQKSLTVNEGDMWGNERAWRRAHRIFTNALLAGWPALSQVRSPSHAIRSSRESPATTPLRDLKSFLTPRKVSETDDDNGSRGSPTYQSVPSLKAEVEEVDGDNLSYQSSYDYTASSPARPPPPPPPFLPIHPRGAYPSFAPDDATFRASILLLGTARAASEIPLTLARMRAMGIAPRTPTLAYALVFWAEVSVGAPLLERWRGASGGEYVRLVKWMEDWVGVENVPDEAAVGEAMRRVDFNSFGSGPGSGSGSGLG
ncbi:hypothetical protein B0F90DRAFT_1732731 [Multifurca ochricompacta]|uniref:Uncharacterized protein n=1 Tax=Multifurca ochricompacta TaxID=376703 RepID=A0AAD4QJR7_9AGAM|nr:hypothetical protein B0F90DRAFT_1732731 [Multifurca ochricompacta]